MIHLGTGELQCEVPLGVPISGLLAQAEEPVAHPLADAMPCHGFASPRSCFLFIFFRNLHQLPNLVHRLRLRFDFPIQLNR